MNHPLNRNDTRRPLLLLVEADSDSRRSLARVLQQRDIRVAIARSIGEASEMLDDLRYIESDIDGLLVDYRLPDGLGSRIVQDFQRENPHVPIALVIDDDDIAMQAWTRARGVALLQKPWVWNQLGTWLEALQVLA